MTVWIKSTSVHLTVDSRSSGHTHTHKNKTKKLAVLASFARLATVIGFQLQERVTAIVCVSMYIRVCARTLVRL